MKIFCAYVSEHGSLGLWHSVCTGATHGLRGSHCGHTVGKHLRIVHEHLSHALVKA